MASPQKENGYTAVANELLEHLLYDTDCTAGELKLLLFVIRKTYGYHKTVDKISLTQFEKGIRYYRANVCRIIKSLVAHKLLLKNGSTYSFNKDWEQWIVAHKLPVANGPLVAQMIAPSSPQATKTSSPQATYKRKKETYTKESISSNKLDVLRLQVKKLAESKTL